MNARLVNVWPTGTGPYMNALHFCFGLGGTIAPLLAVNFLSSTVDTPTSMLFGNSTQIQNQLLIENLPGFKESRIYIPFSVLSIILFIVSACYFFLHHSDINDFKPMAERASGKSHSFPSTKIFLIFLLSTLLFFILGTSYEIGFGNLLTTFSVVGQFRLTKDRGAYLTSVFWSCYTVARFVAIFGGMFLSPKKMIVLHLTCAAFGSALLVIGVSLNDVNCLWVGVGFAGYGIAPMYPK